MGLSDKDVQKLNLMYESMCNTNEVNVLDLVRPEPENPDSSESALFPEIPDTPDGQLTKVVQWIRDFIGH